LFVIIISMLGVIITYLFCILIYCWILKWGDAQRLAIWMHWLPFYPTKPDAYMLLATIWFVVVTIWFLIDILK